MSKSIVLVVDGMSFPLDTTPRQADRPYTSGSVGYFVSGKVVIDGKRHQVSGNAVEIGSNPNKAPKASKTSKTRETAVTL